MRKIRLIALTLILAVSLTACTASSGNVITVDIGSVLPQEASSGARNSMLGWEELQGDYQVEERERFKTYDFIYLGALGQDCLPDVFITDCLTGRTLAGEGLVTELTGYGDSSLNFTYYGRAYAFPVPLESVSVIVYDPLRWEEGDDIAFCSSDGFLVAGGLLSSALGDSRGQEWIRHIFSGDMQALFTDDLFVSALDHVRSMIRDYTDYPSNDELIKAFISGKSPCVIAGGDVLYALLEQTKQADPELYDRIAFRNIEGNVLPCGDQYGVFVRSGMDEQRTRASIDLARSIASGSMIGSDDTISRLEQLSSDSEHVYMITGFLTGNYWNNAGRECFSRLDDEDMTSLEFAFLLQNLYEEYYTY